MKLPTPRRLPSGRWNIYLRLNGQGVSVTEPTKAACVARAQSIKAQYRAGELALGGTDAQEGKDTTPTLGAVLDAYVAKYEAVLSPSTIRGYETIRKNRFQAVMDDPVDQIDYQQAISDDLRLAGPKTIKNAWGLVGAALKDAGHPVPSVKLPPVPPREIPFLQPEEVGPFLAAAEGDGAELVILLLLHGLRISEAEAVIRSRSVDVRAEKIMVRGAVVPDRNHRYIEKQTNKNRTSTRTVDVMIPRLLDLWRRFEAGEYTPTVLHPTVVLRHVNTICERAGVTVVSCHGLRHSAASIAYDLGWSEQAIMDFFGWSNVATAHKVYIRIAQSRKARNTANMRLFFQNADKNADAVRNA